MKCLSIIVLAIILTVSAKKDAANVNIPELGKIKGNVGQSVDGRQFYSFKGVPYAEPPVGINRFEPPKPVQPWKGVLKAIKSTECLQYAHINKLRALSDPIMGTEDCLHLNIYTPTLNQTAMYDVIVYIHGGAFMFSNGGFYEPQVLMNRNVVFVTLNYRLGPMGFLSTEDDVVPGNNGLKDQIEAFKFLKRYVKYFGGNPDSVTITGNSAGGASVHFHFMIKESRGLFHKGISQSGSALNPWALTEKPLEKAQKLAYFVKCNNYNNTKEMVDCLKRVKPRKVVGAVKHFHPWLYHPFTTFGAVVDTWASKPLLEAHPYEILKKGDLYNATWIVSHVNSEGLYPAAELYTNFKYFDQLDKKWTKIMPHILHANDTLNQEQIPSLMRKIRQFYLENRKVSNETFPNLIQLLGDRLFVIDINKAVKLHAKANIAPVYFYYFTYRGAQSRSVTRAGANINWGACHGDDASYIMVMSLNVRSTENDTRMSELMVDIWTSVASTGKPNVTEWSPVDPNSNNVQYLNIAGPDKLQMEDKILGHPELWSTIPFRENENLFS